MSAYICGSMANCDQSTQRIDPKTSVPSATPVWASSVTDWGVSTSVVSSSRPNRVERSVVASECLIFEA